MIDYNDLYKDLIASDFEKTEMECILSDIKGGSPLSAQEKGMFVGYLFFLWEHSRRNKIDLAKGTNALTAMMELRGVTYKSIEREIYFKAELHHRIYYPIADFERLCFQCLEF